MQVKGEIIDGNWKMSETCWANVEELKKTIASLVQKKINKRAKMQILWLEGVIVPEVLMMAEITCNGPNKNTLFNLLPNKTKKWRIKSRWTIKAVAKIKLQIISYFRNRQTRK